MPKSSLDLSLRHQTDLSADQKVLARRKMVGQFRPQLASWPAISGFSPDKINQQNCENLIGEVCLPLGVAGPVKIWSAASAAEFFLPLATTEGALVASVNRGVKAINLAGGAHGLVKSVGMTRAPVFRLPDIEAAAAFRNWLADQKSALIQVTEATSHHLKFLQMQTWQRGNLVFCRFSFDPGQAMGMNMVSVAVQEAWEKVINTYPKVELIALSSNLCTDKKESAINRLLGRGHQVELAVLLPAQVINQVLKTTAAKIMVVHQAKNLVGSNLAGSLSQNMQLANTLTAMYLATGQDVAQVVAAATSGSTFVEQRDQDLYVGVSLPNLEIGVVGGGTALPTLAQARQLISAQPVTTNQLALAMAAAGLAGEISGLAALANHTLVAAHQRLGRAQSTRK